MSPSKHAPLIRLWNTLSPRGAKNRPLVSRDFLDKAVSRCGLSDYGEPDFIEGLETFLTSAQNTGGFHAFGAFYLSQLVLAMLTHRLKLVDQLRTHPEIEQVRIEKPLFVLGLPRSGTTLLFNLLAQDSTHRYMPNWEAFIGQVPPKGSYTFETDPRRKQARWMLRFQKLLMPDLDRVHEFTPGGPEECTPILMQSFTTQAMAGGFDVPEYSEWLDLADRKPTYRHHRRVLQVLQWKYPGQRWLLKSPDHIAALDALLEAYPDARFVHIHRDPAQSVVSWASLNYVYRQPYYDHTDAEKLGHQVFRRLAVDVDRYLLCRDAVPDDRIIDIHYRDLAGDPLTVVEKVYSHFALPLTDATRDSMAKYLASNPENKHGIHHYRAEEFGLDKEAVRQRFDDYTSRFAVPID